MPRRSLILLLLVGTSALLLLFHQSSWFDETLILDVLDTSQIARGQLLAHREHPNYLDFDSSTNSVPGKLTFSMNVHNLHPHTNTHINIFRTCPIPPNNVTNTIRLPRPILNISMVPPGAYPQHQHQYFNPAAIPIPPSSNHQHPYLLLSRLVTQGVHQESHICLATLCRPTPSSSSDTRLCTVEDLEVLGPRGGMRCATAPIRLNVPPTVARRCENAWAAFPDIPGFHDPRLFWSGRGEPLVMVNSGSGVGCVGLWVGDLRGVKGVEELVGLVVEGGGGGGGGGNMHGLGDGVGGAKILYPHLTEIMRNPRKSRGAVEKNWIMFFPKGEESWVQYDLVAHGDKSMSEEVDGVDTAEVEGLTGGVEGETSDIGDGHGRESSQVDVSKKEEHDAFDLGWNKSAITGGTEVGGNTSDTTLRNARKRKNPERSTAQHDQPHLIPSRSIARIVGAGYTTTNLTSPDETPCLTSNDLLDPLGKKGHWHQGSNSLRLILCARQDSTCLSNHDEETLVQSGKVVHFAILHRKFSNNLDLPMRYERHIMTWEARYPFRMVGISQHPILFAGERAQPWTTEENGLVEDEEAKRWEDVYFMYTPSLAWSWRRQNLMSDIGGARAGLGTGYLGDEVLVGIGMDDVAQGVVKVRVEDLLGCLRLCPDFGKLHE